MVTRRAFVGGAAAGLLTVGCLDSNTSPGWHDGELDIHFIPTGVGHQTFFLSPDGT